MWGQDLSGTMDQAGGIGGLLLTTFCGGSTTNCFTAYDGNGNIAALVSTTDQSTGARYEYSPFGEVIRATGPMANANPFRFSSKFCDQESGFVYYGYRYYNPTLGRWIGKDPSEEDGGNNLYAIVENNALNDIDPTGLSKALITW